MGTRVLGNSPSLFLGATQRPAWGWIISWKADLFFFIFGGALASYLLFSLHAIFALDMVVVWFFWFMLLDSPHFFGTYLRTYLDRQELKRRRTLLVGSLGLLCIGPLILLLSYGLFVSNWGGYALPFIIFRSFVSLWAYFHVVRQHYGILSLYKRKNGDSDPWDLRFDFWILHLSLLVPFLVLLSRHPESLSVLSVSVQEWALVSRDFLGQIGMWLVGAMTAVFLVRQGWQYQRTGAFNLPKVLLLVVLAPLHTFLCYHPATLTTSMNSFGAFVTIFHDFQYLAIVWFYQRGKCHAPGQDPSRFGVAGLLTRHVSFYIAAFLLMGLASAFAVCRLEVFPGCTPWWNTKAVHLFGVFSVSDLLMSLLLGILLLHYFVDQFIWRPSKDAEVRATLALQ